MIGYLAIVSVGLQGMDYIGNDTPHLEAHVLLNLDGFVILVFRYQENTVLCDVKPSYCQFSVQDRYDNPVVDRFERTIHDQDISVMYSRIDHGVSGHPYKEGRYGVLDKVLIQIQLGLYIVLCGGRESPPRLAP